MYICGWTGKRGALPPKSWYALVSAAIGPLAEVQDWPHWDGDNLVIATSQKALPLLDKQASRAVEVPLPLEGWAYEMAKPERSPSRPLSPSKPEDEAAVISPLLGDDTSRFQRGLAIHRLLQTLPELPPEKRRVLGLGWLSPALSPDVVDEALAVINHPDTAPIFGLGSRAEVPIVGLVGNRAISGQIDRLLVTDEAIWLADYKTNRPPPAKVELVAPAYLRQLATYRAILARIYPDRPIHAVLIWTFGPVVMPIPTALLDANTP
jgi:ATP-dependent helicase/nuclease subunit A